MGEISNRDYFSKFFVFPYKGVVRIKESIQNQAFRVCSENDTNDLIQKDKIWQIGKEYFIFYFFSDKLSHYITYVCRKLLILDAFKRVRCQIFDR